MNYIPFRPTKNKAFRLYFQFSKVDMPIDNDNITIWKNYISKDAGAFTELTNTPVEIDSSISIYAEGNFYVDLTADETNADSILIQSRTNASGVPLLQIVIYTKGSSCFDDDVATSTSLVNLYEATSKGYNLTNQELGDTNYYGLKKSGFRFTTWLIIKEVPGVSIQYCQRNGNDTYTEAWGDKENLTYSDTVRLR